MSDVLPKRIFYVNQPSDLCSVRCAFYEALCIHATIPIDVELLNPEMHRVEIKYVGENLVFPEDYYTKTNRSDWLREVVFEGEMDQFPDFSGCKILQKVTFRVTKPSVMRTVLPPSVTHVVYDLPQSMEDTPTFKHADLDKVKKVTVLDVEGDSYFVRDVAGWARVDEDPYPPEEEQEDWDDLCFSTMEPPRTPRMWDEGELADQVVFEHEDEVIELPHPNPKKRGGLFGNIPVKKELVEYEHLDVVQFYKRAKTIHLD